VSLVDAVASDEQIAGRVRSVVELSADASVGDLGADQTLAELETQPPPRRLLAQRAVKVSRLIVRLTRRSSRVDPMGTVPRCFPVPLNNPVRGGNAAANTGPSASMARNASRPFVATVRYDPTSDVSGTCAS
jgi:hypothetical protein